jgi:hypothetical protein
MFWSGADFGEKKLNFSTGKFKDAAISYTSTVQVDLTYIKVWLRNPEKYNGTIKT